MYNGTRLSSSYILLLMMLNFLGHGRVTWRGRSELL